MRWYFSIRRQGWFRRGYVEDEGERKSCEKYAEMKGQEGLEGGEGCARL